MSADDPTSDRRWDLSKFRGDNYDKGRGKVWQVAWLTVDSLIFRRWWLPASIRSTILRWFGADIAGGVLIRHDVKIHWPWKLTIGENSWVGAGAWLLNLEPINIGSNTCISQDAFICTGSHDRHSPTFEFDNAPITIGSCVWIGARATVLRGVTIGGNSTVGSTALVVRDVPPATTVVATPGIVRSEDR